MIRTLLRALSFAILCAVAASASASERTVKVFAAASMADALDAVFAAFEAETGVQAVGVYAASGALARQIDAGAPADLYISAHPDWMDWLSERGALEGPPTAFAGNRLVVATSTPTTALLDDILLHKTDRIAVADLRAAPAGRYAAQALTSLGLFERVKSKLIEASDARAAAAWVARGEAWAGILYETDAALAGLPVAYRLNETRHDPIVYLLATVKGAQPEAKMLRDYLMSAKARDALADRGFTPPPEE